MAQTKGITIQFNSETTELDRALKDIQKESNAANKSLKGVNSALKFNPNNTELLAQKMTILNTKIKDTDKSVKQLKDAQRQLDDQGVDKNSEQYMKVRRSIIEAESKLKTYRAELLKTQAAASKMGQTAATFQQMGSKITAAGNAMRGLSMAAAGLTASLAGLTAKSAKWADDIITGSKVYSVSTKELQKYNAAAELTDVNAEALVKTHRKLERNMLNAQLGSKKQALAFEELGVKYENADGSLRKGDEVWQDTIEALSKMTNETERDAYAMALMGRSATDLNPIIEDGAEGYKILTDAMSKYDLEFVDKKTLDRANAFQDQMDLIKSVTLIALQNIGSRLAGFLLPAIQKVAEAAGRLAKWISNLSPAVLTFVGVLSGIVAAAAPVLLVFGHMYTAMGNSLKILSQLVLKIPFLSKALTMLTGPIGIIIGIFMLLFTTNEKFRKSIMDLVGTIMTALKPIIAVIIGLINQLVPIISQLVTEIGNAVVPIIQALTPLLTMVVSAIGKIVGAIMKAAVPAMKKLTPVISSVVSVLAKAVTGVLNFAGKIGSAFNKVKNAMVHPIETAKNLIKAIIDKIKGFFNIKVKAPNIPLPHFKISPKGWKMKDLLKGKIPKLSVDWHAQGGIFTRPTILQGADGTFHGFGDGGAEAVLPLDRLNSMMMSMADSIVNGVVAAQSFGNTGAPVTIQLYNYPNGQKMDEVTVQSYDRGKRRIGK